MERAPRLGYTSLPLHTTLVGVQTTSMSPIARRASPSQHSSAWPSPSPSSCKVLAFCNTSKLRNVKASRERKGEVKGESFLYGRPSTRREKVNAESTGGLAICRVSSAESVAVRCLASQIKRQIFIFAHMTDLPTHGDDEEDDEVDEEDGPENGDIEEGESGGQSREDDRLGGGVPAETISVSLGAEVKEQPTHQNLNSGNRRMKGRNSPSCISP